MGKMMSGGVESMVMNYYRHINKSKVQFDFIIDEDSTIVPYDEIERLGGRVFKIPPYQKAIAYHKSLVKLFRENNYRIVHSHINTLSIFPLFAAKRAGVQTRIAHSHSTAGKGETMRNILKYTLRPLSKVFPTHYCACSEHAGRWLFGDKLYNQGAVIIVRNAIDLAKFRFDSQTREDVRKELNIKSKFALVHVGRFMAQKNHSFLIDIFEQIQKLDSNSVLFLVGEGELEQQTRNKVSQLGLDDHVRFLGVRNDVHRLLMGMDAFLLPSNYEGLGIVAVEAQATQLNVIASDMVPAEARISNSIEFISLNSSPKEWAEVILSYRLEKSKANPIIDYDYDIENASELLLGIYQATMKGT